MNDGGADPLSLPATPERVLAVAAAAGMSEVETRRALRIAAATPAPAEWRRFLSRALALLGTALLLAGAVCFFAYNWARIGRLGKFALIEGGIVGAALAAWRLLPRLAGRLALTAAAVLVGPLLGVYGQAYQTGADPYGLFLTWFLITLPWVAAARFAPLCVLAVVLLDVGLALYCRQALEPAGTSGDLLPFLAVAGVHLASLVAWEWQARRAPPWLEERWPARAIALGAFGALLVPAGALILAGEEAGAPGVIGLAALVAAIAAAFHWHRRVRPDRLVLTLAAAAGLALVAVAAGRVVFVELDLEESGFLLMALVLLAEITLGLHWLRRARREPGGGEARP
jgi:uncharacterized membrane protein